MSLNRTKSGNRTKEGTVWKANLPYLHPLRPTGDKRSRVIEKYCDGCMESEQLMIIEERHSLVASKRKKKREGTPMVFHLKVAL